MTIPASERRDRRIWQIQDIMSRVKPGDMTDAELWRPSPFSGWPKPGYLAISPSCASRLWVTEPDRPSPRLNS